MDRFLRSRRGSSAVFLAMAFVAFSLCIAASIGVSRRLVIKSECEAFGRVWARAILSEYDRHLLSDYGLMAYFGNEIEVRDRIDTYLDYSAAGKLDVKLGKTGADLTGYELGDPDNFRTAMKKGAAGSAIGSVISGRNRNVRPDVKHSSDDSTNEGEDRKIGNTVVLDTLPSAGIGNSVDVDRIVERARSLGDSDSLMSAVAGSGIDIAFIWQHFGNNVTTPDDGKAYFRNEWEYILNGQPSDQTNLKSCRRKLFLIRNALDMASLYKDPSKVELLVTAAELITPGPLGAATQLLLAEAWAALEAEQDLKDLYEGGRVPVLKSPGEWKTGLESVLDSDSVRKKLDEESKELLDENREELGHLGTLGNAGAIISSGLNYDEHLILMILAMKESTRLLRIMDLVQINMKYRYYRDFDLMEYFVGVRYTIKAQGRDYYFEDCYK